MNQKYDKKRQKKLLKQAMIIDPDIKEDSMGENQGRIGCLPTFCTGPGDQMYTR